MFRHRSQPLRRGFTLIEILVVVAIIGILAAVVFASLGDAREQANIRKAQADMRNIHTAMELLQNDTGLYPHRQPTYCPPWARGGNEVNLASSSQGLMATDGTFENWNGPYVSDVTDPWGMPYFLDEDYFCTAGATGCEGEMDSSLGQTSAIISCGPNMQIGSGPTPYFNGIGCAYDDDNIVYVLCRE